jgi:hypothetical protein
MSFNVEDFQNRVTVDLREAMKARDTVKVSTLRSLLARISNAESVKVEVAASDSAIAGAQVGVGATEVARRVLSEDDVQALIAAELAELLETIGSVGEQSEYGQELRRKAEVIEQYSLRR